MSGDWLWTAKVTRCQVVVVGRDVSVLSQDRYGGSILGASTFVEAAVADVFVFVLFFSAWR